MKALTPAQLDSYREQGFVFPLRVFDTARALGLRRRFEAFERGAMAARYAGREHELYRFKAHLLFTWADEIVHNPRSLDVIEDVIGPNILAWTVGVFVKDPHSDYAVPWHQDSAHTGVDQPDKLVRLWHALSVARPENGTMRLLPGSHKLGELRHISRSTSDGLALRDAHADIDIDEARTVPATLAAGEACLFSGQTLHSSGPSTSDERRINVVVAYMPPSVRPASAEESAMLVRGVDRYGHWRREPRPRADMDPAAITAHRRAREARLATYFAGD